MYTLYSSFPSTLMPERSRNFVFRTEPARTMVAHTCLELAFEKGTIQSKPGKLMVSFSDPMNIDSIRAQVADITDISDPSFS